MNIRYASSANPSLVILLFRVVALASGVFFQPYSVLCIADILHVESNDKNVATTNVVVRVLMVLLTQEVIKSGQALSPRDATTRLRSTIFRSFFLYCNDL